MQHPSTTPKQLSKLLIVLTLTLLLPAVYLAQERLSHPARNGQQPRARLGCKGVMGFVITTVESGSSVEQAGLKPGDIITDVGKVQINSIEQLQGIISTSDPGTPFEITYLRFNPATVTHEEHKATVKSRALRSQANPISDNTRKSATVQKVSAE